MEARRFISRLVAFAVLSPLLPGATAAYSQSISVSVISNVGSGLQGNQHTATLSTSQHGGKTVHVESDNPAVVLVAPNPTTAGAASFDVFVPNGTSTLTFVVSGVESTTGTATVTVSAPGFTSGSRPATIVQPALDITGLITSIDTLDPADLFQVRVGLPMVGNGSVNPAQSVRAGGTGFTATIINSNAVAGELITTALTGQTVTVSITPGNSSSPSSLAAGGVTFDGLDVGSTTVSASIPGFITTTAASVNVNVTQPALTLFAIGNVGAGLQGSSIGVALSASQHGGVTMGIKSADPAIALVAPNASTPGTDSISVFIPNGTTSTSIVVSGMEGVEGASLITCSVPGFIPASQLASIQQPALDVVVLQSTIDTLDPVDPFQVRIGLPGSGNTSVNPVQSIRAGGVAVVATIRSTAAAIGDLITSALTADTVTVTISPGNALSPSTVATGGVAFDGVALGATTVSAVIPGFVSTANATQIVTVTQPAITLFAIGNTGAGLQGTAVPMTLEASQHGGVTVHVESDNPSVALVAPNATTAGSTSFDQFMANGATATQLVVAGMSNTTGTATITVSAPGFSPVSRVVTIVQPGLDIVGLNSSIDTLDPNDVFQVRVGVPFNGNNSVNPSQLVRVGGSPLTATIVHSNSAVADLVTTALTADTVTVSITPGNSLSGASVAAGGVAFDGVALGSTNVSASIPNFIATTGAQVTVTVTQPAISILDIPTVGAGLQGSLTSISFSVSQHGGFTLHVESSNPSVALVAPNQSTPGSASFDVLIANGVTSSTVVVHGLENVTGTADITASAVGFTSATKPASIVQPAIDLIGLGTSFDVTDPDDVFQVRIGLPTVGNTAVNPAQPARVGGPGLTSTIMLSNATPGRLVTTAASDDTVMVAISPGQFLSPATVVAGGVAFDPLAVGSTLVSATMPGFIVTGAATQLVTVSQRSITMGSIGDVGAGLQSGAVNATLGLSSHGGVTVHVESSNPSVALVSPGFAAAGSASADFPLSNGSTQISFYVHGVATGAATITASVPTFTSGMSAANVVQPALTVALLADSIMDNASNDAFVVRVGLPAGDLSTVATAQAVRAGSPSLTATVSSSDAAIAALVTSSQNGSPVTVSIPAGATQSAATAAAGGVELDPLLPGATTIAATIPGYIATASASRLVTVTSHQPPTGVETPPLALALGQNVPNPFNPHTTIDYAVPAGGAHVNISIYDVSGRIVIELVDEHRPPGRWSVDWDGRDQRGARAASGVYFYRMSARGFVDTKKMVMIR